MNNPPDSNPSDEWLVDAKHVLAELARHGKNIEFIRKEQVALRMDFLKGLSGIREDFQASIRKMEVELAMLKVKSGVWGLIGGAIPVAVALLVYFLTSGIK
jgi:hypothetical protein